MSAVEGEPSPQARAAMMTLAEQASLTSGVGMWHTRSIERLGVPEMFLSDGPHGLRAQPYEGDHAGLTASVPATCMPTASALGCTWNPALVHEVGAALAREARVLGVSVILGPAMNIKRSPLGGRNFEYFSEDPFLTARLATSFVEGIQRDGDVGACVKHFAVNNQETDRLRVNAVVDDRALREVYLSAFEHVVRTAEPWMVMASYNQVNGTPVTENAELLTTILRDEWGFAGVVVSDWAAVRNRIAALVAGTDLEMPPADGSPTRVVDAVATGRLPPARLADAAGRVATLAVRSRHCPRAANGIVPEGDDSCSNTRGVEPRIEPAMVSTHHELAQRAATESMVLLVNDGTLPLPRDTRLAVVGDFATTPRIQGGGSSKVAPTRVDHSLDELRESVAHVEFAPGTTSDDLDAAAVAHAASIAGDADVALVMLGLNDADETEGVDRTHLALPSGQLRLLEAVANTGTPVVAAVFGGAPVDLRPVLDHAAAVLQCGLAGQGMGRALADIVSGRATPTGRLSQTIPVRLQDDPSYPHFPGGEGTVRYGEGVFVGYRGYDIAEREVLFPFGYGLGYSTSSFSLVDTDVCGSIAGGDLTVRLDTDVRNTGAREVTEVVQAYVRPPAADVARPVRTLAGFVKVGVPVGGTTRVTLTLDQRAFMRWSERHDRWVVDPGVHIVELARHSRDVCAEVTVTLDGDRPDPILDAESTLEEWMADPRGAALVRGAIDDGQPNVLARNLQVLGSMPMRALSAFPNLSLDLDSVHRISTEWSKSRLTE